MRILFIGNSHTYVNDMPEIVARLAKKDGIDCEVAMIAHGGWFLEQHAAEPETRFNILYGNYDYVVLQEHAHPFGPEGKMLSAAEKIGGWIHEAKSTAVAYMTWTEKGNEAEQARMAAAYQKMAKASLRFWLRWVRNGGNISMPIRKPRCMRRMGSMRRRGDPNLRRR